MKSNYAKRVVNFSQDIENAQNYIKENFGINCSFDEETSKIHLWTSNINESLQLVAAKEYLIKNIGEDFVEIVYGR